VRDGGGDSFPSAVVFRSAGGELEEEEGEAREPGEEGEAGGVDDSSCSASCRSRVSLSNSNGSDQRDFLGRNSGCSTCRYLSRGGMRYDVQNIGYRTSRRKKKVHNDVKGENKRK
jgi:hypothetical protein